MQHPESEHDPIRELISQAVECDTAEERRRHPRSAVDAILVVQPVDEQGQVCGNTYMAQCRDISEGGISFICNRPINAKYLQLDSMTPGFGLAAITIEVLRSKAEQNQIEIAGKFVILPFGEPPGFTPPV